MKNEMGLSTDLREDQVKLWNGTLGETWVEAQAFIDGMLRSLEELLVDAVSALSPKQVLDVGCGNGTTTLAIARAVAPEGQCTGIDLSKPMLENAQSRASSCDVEATFICADAGDQAFGDIKFDVFTSRFGVMFFADPVAAFTNLRSAAAEQAELVFLVWRAPDENDFLTAAQRAAAPFLPELPPRDPTLPGPFSMAHPERVHAILAASGWKNIALHPVDLPCVFQRSDLDLFLTKLAPIGHDIESLEQDIREDIVRAVQAAYKKFVHETEVQFTASCWLINASAT